MRYTTIIDIRPMGIAYRSVAVRLVYLHLVLVSGYHDNDRDIWRISIRNLAAETGLTVSATRHALKVLEKWDMIRRIKGVWYVRKWVPMQAITPRKEPKPSKKELTEVRIAEAKKIDAQLSTLRSYKEAGIATREDLEQLEDLEHQRR